MGDQYKLLLSKFSEASSTGNFNFSDPKLAIPRTVIEKVGSLSRVSLVDSRLVLEEHVGEISNFTIDPDTERTFAVGDNR